jgi:hypothetical protein
VTPTTVDNGAPVARARGGGVGPRAHASAGQESGYWDAGGCADARTASARPGTSAPGRRRGE